MWRKCRKTLNLNFVTYFCAPLTKRWRVRFHFHMRTILSGTNVQWFPLATTVTSHAHAISVWIHASAYFSSNYVVFLGFAQRYALTRVPGFFLFALHPRVNSIRLHSVPFCFTSVHQCCEDQSASRHKWWTERGAHAKWHSPNFIHQVVHLTHQPLVLLLKLDRTTKLKKNKTKNQTPINTVSELNGTTV